MRPVIITGVLGFLGRYLAREMVAQKMLVVGVDMSEPRVSTIAQDGVGRYHRIRMPSNDFQRLVEDCDPELIIHAAGPASVQESLLDPEGDFNSSAAVLHSMMDAVRKAAPRCRVVYLSSAAVYGNPSTLPIDEDAEASPISPYGFHKLICESILQEYHKIYNIGGCSLRIFSAYGAGLKKQLLWDVVQKAMKSDAVMLSGTGNETRDYIHARDIAKAVSCVARSADFCSETYNLASGSMTTIRDIAELVVDSLGRGVRLEFNGQCREGDPLLWRADVSRIRSLGYEPEIELSAGIADYVRWALGEPSV